MSTDGLQLSDAHLHYVRTRCRGGGLIENLARLETMHTQHTDFAAECTAITNNTMASQSTHRPRRRTSKRSAQGLCAELSVLAATTPCGVGLEEPLRLRLPRQHWLQDLPCPPRGTSISTASVVSVSAVLDQVPACAHVVCPASARSCFSERGARSSPH